MIKDLLTKIPAYKSFRAFGHPMIFPVNLTINSTFHCVSKCQTCNVWKKNVKELSLPEWKKIFRSIGPNLYWLIVSGGEPFLRKDLAEICQVAHRYCWPKVINIPTNGFLFETIPATIEKILDYCPDTEIIINFSLDGMGGEHDKIRQLKGSYENLLKSFKAVRKIKNPNLVVGIHTVVSKLNYRNLPRIYKFVTEELKPDSYITEIAERRVELDNLDLDLVPEEEEYRKAINFLLSKMKKKKFKGFSKITHALRINYYQLVKKVLHRKTQIIPCYGGFASAQISADGKVWPCCVRGDEMGDLRKANYDFRKIWKSKEADGIRQSIKRRECHCPLASASYTSMLMNPGSLFKIMMRILGK